jgi:hypothetical protein
MPMSAARHAWRRAAATVLAAGAFAGCGQASRPAANDTSATPRPAATQTARQRLTPLIYIWRNLEYAATPDEMTVYTNNEVRYRNHLHTQTTIKTLSAELRPAQVANLRRLLADIDLDRADASAVKPPRWGYRYIIRSHGHLGTAADGHLRGPMRRLVRTLGAQMDRMQAHSL